jgi:hypothetical protein
VRLRAAGSLARPVREKAKGGRGRPPSQTSERRQRFLAAVLLRAVLFFAAVLFLAAGLRRAVLFFAVLFLAAGLRAAVFRRAVDFLAADFLAVVFRLRVAAAFLPAVDRLATVRFRVAAPFLPAVDRFAAVRFRVAAAFLPAVDRLADVRFRAVLFLAGAIPSPFRGLCFTTPCASGACAPVRSCPPTRRTARRGEARSSDTRCERGTHRRSSLPPSMSLPSRGRRSPGRNRDTALVLAKGCNGARPSPPKITRV